jgi:hypothetical protein
MTLSSRRFGLNRSLLLKHVLAWHASGPTHDQAATADSGRPVRKSLFIVHP